ncbi:hypothetical protein VOLCADRAFT_74427 [Volvox carteri f. nagariensis]|uniref:serine O-acetyltransferase n=1 Tax=Volvox carteri f. nagariensis TaxID=3068 RepID=D8TU51_VOLCA|nr:uncharacterized protein VOLCADRAFT_74427 [Volvox carteri f. nagariensis]EFJ49080.1 hypothetical protein VOLCADRAFT_74427 [Volvox carteri f. nagariensis]|eukprot:XP_002949977.1 hypothetical protein VOLCADRAFT_74427 [Volvox carteri f. nagariensis]
MFRAPIAEAAAPSSSRPQSQLSLPARLQRNPGERALSWRMPYGAHCNISTRIKTMARDRLSADEVSELESLRARLNQQLRLATVPTEYAGQRVSKANDCPECPGDEYHPSQGWRPQPHHLSKDQLWSRIREEAQQDAASEPALASNLYSTILAHPNIEKSMAFLLANKLSSPTMLGMQLMRLIQDVYEDDQEVMEACLADLQAVYDRDPACDRYTQAILYFKGFQAVQSYRIAHWLWQKGRKALALALQSRISEVFHVDIHPAAEIGRGIMIDHATGVVIGETAVVGDNVSMLHHVTLGGSGTGRGVRHPTIGHGVLLGAGVTVLGAVMVGAGSKVGAGSVVVSDIPCHSVAVGVPARIIKRDIIKEPVKDMDQCVDFVLNYDI